MTPQEFLDEFGTLAESAEGVPKLRELILELAVRGKLVEQDEGESPVDELLDQIEREKDRLVAEKIIRKPRKADEVNGEHHPFDVPDHWRWRRLAHIGQIVGGGTPKTGNPEFFADDGVRWITPADLSNIEGKYISKGRRDISPLGLEKSSAQLMPTGTVLFSSRAPIGHLAIAANEISTNQGFKSIVPFVTEMNEFVYYFLKHARSEIEANASGTTFKEVSGAIVSQVMIPVPPLAEQHRIVSKVDELMGLCDRLEAVQGERRGVRVRLNRSSLDRLTSVSTARGSGLSAAWQRVCDHFEVLYDTPETLPDLRQTILQLAVQGKLVPQDPNDEPADALLPQIKEERKSEGHAPIKFTAKTYDEIADGSTVLDTWQLPALANVALTIVDCPHSTPKWTDSGMICVRTNQFSPGHLDLSNVRYVSDETYQERIQRLEPAHNDILYSREGGILGVACRVPEKTRLCLGQRMMLIRPPSTVDPAYLELVLNSPHITSVARHKTTGAAAPRVNVATVKAYPIPLPGLSEQKRIVSKVTHLLSQVTRLESILTRRESTRTQLLTAAIHSLLNDSHDEDPDRELIQSAIRTADNGKKVEISVGTVVWDGPHTPRCKWVKARSLPKTSTQSEIDQAIRGVLNNKRFFRVCPECKRRMLVGHMMKDYCQSCGEKNHEIVY